jgi:hypothetical protein
VYRLVVAVEIKPVKRGVGDDPLSDLQHALVVNDEIDGGAQTLAYRPTPAV